MSEFTKCEIVHERLQRAAREWLGLIGDNDALAATSERSKRVYRRLAPSITGSDCFGPIGISGAAA